MRTSPIIACCLALGLALASACDNSGGFRATVPPPGGSTSDKVLETVTGRLQAGLTMEDVDDVVGLRFVVRDAEGIIVAEEKVLEDEYLPADLAPQGGASHRFADAYFVLPEGEYQVQAIPIDASGQRSQNCAEAFGVATVVGGQTTEIILVCQCYDPENGGVDIVALLNHAPRVLQLVFDDSKWILTCEDLWVTAEAMDPDGDPLVWEWTVSGHCRRALFEAEDLGDSFHFLSLTAGDYEVTLKVCEDAPAPVRCAELTFPIHVQLSTDEDGDGVGDECDDCTWQEEIGTCEPVAGTTVGAPALLDDYSCCGLVESGPEQAFVFIPEHDCEAVVTLTGLTADLDLFVLTEACDATSCIAKSNRTGMLGEKLDFAATAGTPYHIVVDGYEGDTGEFTLTVVCDESSAEVCPSSPL